MGLKQVIVLRSDLGMAKGKLASQASHASLEAFLKCQKKDPQLCREWIDSGMPKIVLKAGSQSELVSIFESAKKRVAASLICDAGKTQVESGSKTAIALGPADESVLNHYTGHLKLL